MPSESRVQKALRNSLWNILGYIAPLAVAIFVTPIIVFGLGQENYGIYIFFVSVIAMLGLLDLGISTALSRYITEYYGNHQIEKIRHLLKSANTLAVVIGIIGFLACIVLGAGGDALLTGGVASHALWYYILTGLIFLVNSASFIYISIPNALQRFDISTKIGTILVITSSIANIIAVQLGYGITALLVIQLILSIVTTMSFRVFAHKLIPKAITLEFGWSWTEIKEFYAFGLKTFMTSIGNSSTTYLSRLIIPFYLGPTALTYYSVPGNVANKTPGITSAFANILFPMTVDLSARGEYETIKIAYVRSFRLIAILSAAATTGIIIFAQPILLYWLDMDFVTHSTTVLIVLALTNFILALYGPLYNLLIGLSQLRVLIICSFTMAGINIIGLFLLLTRFHIEGAAFAYLVSTLPIFYMLYYIEHIQFKLTGRARYYLIFILKLLTTAGLTYLISYFVYLPLTVNFLTLFIMGPVTVCTFLGLYRLLGFYEAEDVRDLSTFLKKVFLRRAVSVPPSFPPTTV